MGFRYDAWDSDSRTDSLRMDVVKVALLAAALSHGGGTRY
jgi:hypothetical protein